MLLPQRLANHHLTAPPEKSDNLDHLDHLDHLAPASTIIEPRITKVAHIVMAARNAKTMNIQDNVAIVTGAASDINKSAVLKKALDG